MIKEFDVKQGGRSPKRKENKRLADEAVARIKETGDVSEDDYLAVTKAGREKEVEPQLAKVKNENTLSVPNSFYELTIPEQSMLMFYLARDYECPFTGKKTFMNMLYSYASSHLSEEEIKKVWNLQPLTDGDGQVYDVKLKIKNYKKFHEIRQKALMAFNQNYKIADAWHDLVKMSFVIKPEELIKTAIIQDALESEDYKDRNQNRRMAMDILGLGKEFDQSGGVNVWIQGGGQELVDVIQGVNDDEYLPTKNDLKVDD